MMSNDGLSIVAGYCPGKTGVGVGVRDADFELRFAVAEDRYLADGGLPEVYGVFIAPGAAERDRDLMETDRIEVLRGSPIAKIVDEISSDKSGEMQREVGKILKTGAAMCHCYFAHYCPKLGAANLLSAMETAIVLRKLRRDAELVSKSCE